MEFEKVDAYIPEAKDFGFYAFSYKIYRTPENYKKVLKSGRIHEFEQKA